MKYILFEHFAIHTKLSPDEVFYRLRAAVDKKSKGWIFANKPFWGKVHRHDFRIQRYRGWWRRSTPVVLGEIQPEDPGCRLQIKIRLSWLDYFVVFSLLEFLWYSFLMSHANLIIQIIQTGVWQFNSVGEWLFSVAAFIVFLACFSLIPLSGFASEARFIKNQLLKMSETTEGIVNYQDRILGFTESQVISAIVLIPIVFSIGWMIYRLVR